MEKNINSIWQGRDDGDHPLAQRVYQRVKETQLYDLIEEGNFALHGFAVDEGVRRNKGRVGAQKAPNTIRKNMSNFPVINPTLQILDFGDVRCDDGDLETSQSVLADKVKIVLRKGAKSIILGGGHEITYAHYSGIKSAFPNKTIGIVNIDAHFDNRAPIHNEATSGTGFYQIAQEGEINSLHIGIQKNSNTLLLFDTAHQFGMKYIMAEDIYYDNLSVIKEKIDALFHRVNVVYLTICMDTFNASIAPGVSALAYNGIFADHVFINILQHIVKSKKLVAMDVAEVNPLFDEQEKTARLAASFLNEWLMI